MDSPPPPDFDEDASPFGDDYYEEEDPPPPDDEEDPPFDDEGQPPDDDMDDAPSFSEDFSDEEPPPPSEDGPSEPPASLPDSSVSDDLPPPSILSPVVGGPGRPANNSYLLPVRPPQSDLDDLSAPTPDLSVIESLSAGLAVKITPALTKLREPVGSEAVRKSAATMDVTVTDEAESPSLTSDQRSQQQSFSRRASLSAAVVGGGITGGMAPQAEEVEGFIRCLGKFEGDPYEELFIRVENKTLLVRVSSGEFVDFNLSSRAYVFEDTAERRSVILDYRKTPILLLFPSDDSFVDFMKSLPEEVFMSPDDEPVPEEKDAKREETKKSQPQRAPATTTQSRIQHVKGQSVEDILENDDFETPQQRTEKVAALIGVGGTTADVTDSETVPGPPRRKDVLDSYLRRPKYCVRRVALLCSWINSLHIWSEVVSVHNLHTEMANGILLARLVKALNPEVQFVQLNEKPLAKKAAVENLEQALGHIWRSKSLHNQRIPTAEEVYSGDASKIAILVNELFSVYVAKPLVKQQAMKVLRWFHSVLKQYGRSFPTFVLEDGDLSGLWQHFHSGTALFCVLYHFFGTSSVGEGTAAQRVNPLSVFGEPVSLFEFRENLIYVFDLLQLLKIEVIWTVEDWLTHPDSDFLLLQLSLIYERLKFQQCVLPPAQGEKPGITSGPNGEPVVVGLVFADAPSSLKFVVRSKKAVRLGLDRESMPLLPVNDGRRLVQSRFCKHGHLPRGMLTTDVHLHHIDTDTALREARVYSARGDWNSRTAIKTEKDRDPAVQALGTLRPLGSVNVPSLSLANTQRVKEGHSPCEGSDPRTVDTGTISRLRQQGQPSLDDFNKEITSLVRSLEDEMLKAQRDLQSAEDSLAVRYQDLEASSHLHDARDYANLLERLESERVELENEKDHLKEYFTRKLALIKERKAELHKRALESKPSPAGGQMLNKQFANSTSQVKEADVCDRRKTTRKPASLRDTKQAEKGWIKLSAKMNTHNFHLRHKQQIAVAAFQAKIAPKHLLGADKTTTSNSTTNGRSMRGFSPNQLQRSTFDTMLKSEVNVQDSFQRFKVRLQVASDKWLQARNVHKPRSVVQEILQSGLKSPMIELISVPGKSVLMEPESSRESLLHDQSSLQYHIRIEELTSMYFEDERRRMVLAETEILDSLQRSQRIFDRTEFAQTYSLDNRASFVDIESLLRYLAAPHSLIIQDRVPKEFAFELVDRDTVEDAELGQFSWKWEEIGHRSTDAGFTDSGFVHIEDIQFVSIAPEPDVLVVQLIDSAKALKNSRGRISLTLGCSSPNERDRLVYSLNALLKFVK